MKKFMLLIALSIGLLGSTVLGQDITVTDFGDIQCGDIIEGEFVSSFEQHQYSLNMTPGDSFDASATTLGDQLLVRITGATPTGNSFVFSEDGSEKNIEQMPSLNSGILSARGDYLVAISNYKTDFDRPVNREGQESVGGVYTLFIGCTLRDGTVIESGDTMPEPAPPAPVQPDFSGFGFPGLPAVDFTNIAEIPLTSGVPMSGAITPTGDEVIGFTFDGSEGQQITLDFTRLSGNVNMGLVLLQGENTIVYQASLTTSESMSTTLTLPSSGTYTVGVFRVDLLAVDNPQASAFQIQMQTN